MKTPATRTGIDITSAEIRDLATPLTDDASLDPLLASIGDARFVLLGEASHGTAEYYRRRAALTQRLIAEHDFSFVGVEGDWPDCFRVNRWVKGQAEQDRSARDVLAEFDRWPTWMWANEEVADFVSWLRTYNAETGRAIGFYGLDVYSLWESLYAVFDYLEEHHPDALDIARKAVYCFEPYGEDPQTSAWSSRISPEVC